MAAFKYELKIGEYDSSVKVDIELVVKDGVDKEDYETIRTALNKVEETVRKYRESLYES